MSRTIGRLTGTLLAMAVTTTGVVTVLPQPAAAATTATNTTVQRVSYDGAADLRFCV